MDESISIIHIPENGSTNCEFAISSYPSALLSYLQDEDILTLSLSPNEVETETGAEPP